MRLLVCGSRTYAERRKMWKALDEFVVAHGVPSVVLHGDADGADRLADRWARKRGYEVTGYPASWHRHGKAAGPRRNAFLASMLVRADYVLAFCDKPLEESTGTADMVAKALARKLPRSHVLVYVHIDEDER